MFVKKQKNLNHELSSILNLKNFLYFAVYILILLHFIFNVVYVLLYEESGYT